jgi:oligosaccharide repeat unit polymerase
MGWRGRGYFLIIIASMAANFSWGNRYNIALTLIVLGMSWHYYIAPLRIFRTLLWAVASILCLQFLRDLRGVYVADVRGGTFSGLDNKWLEISASLHFVEFDAFLLSLRDAGDMFDFRNGADFYNGILSWVPRSIYPGKETFNIGPWFRQVYEPSKINGWPVTVMGSWYINFSWIGIPIGGFISGFIMRVIDAAFHDARGNPWHAAIGTGIAIFVVEGGINTGFPQEIFLLFLPLALASTWIKLAAKSKVERTSRKYSQQFYGQRF